MTTGGGHVDVKDTVALLEVVATSLRDHPDQCSPRVTIAGMVGTSGSPIVGIASGGAPGSSAIGISSTLSVTGSRFEQRVGNSQEETRQAAQLLQEVADELRKPTPDPVVVKSHVEKVSTLISWAHALVEVITCAVQLTTVLH